jgi:hypothetical protein
MGETLLNIGAGMVFGWLFCEMKHSGMISAAWRFITDPDARRVSKGR